MHEVHLAEADLTSLKAVPDNLAGALMANSLHFVREQETFLMSEKEAEAGWETDNY